jgi:hypothetical protein
MARTGRAGSSRGGDPPGAGCQTVETGVRESLTVIVHRALRTGRGPESLVRYLDGRPAGSRRQVFRMARAVAAELAPAVAEQRLARAASVTGGETLVG